MKGAGSGDSGAAAPNLPATMPSVVLGAPSLSRSRGCTTGGPGLRWLQLHVSRTQHHPSELLGLLGTLAGLLRVGPCHV